MSTLTPLVATISALVPNVAAGSTDNSTIGKAPFAGTVTSVTFVPDAAMTGNDTNYRTVTVINKGTNGSGTKTVASLAFLSGVNGTAFDEKTITLDADAADITVAEGDILVWNSVFTASGIADPGGLVTVSISRA